jgi:hypothetical protein
VYQDAGNDGQANGVNVPSGQRTEIETLTIPVTGDYTIVAQAEPETNEPGSTANWKCDLDAQNPGGSLISLDGVDATQYETGLTSSSASMELQGVVSIGAGGQLSLWCQETAVQKNDAVAQSRITATQVSSFTTGS